MYFLWGDQIMVWVVCSGVIPPYNSGGGGVLKCSLSERAIFCCLLSLSVFASYYIWWLPVKLNRRCFLWRSFIILAYLLRPEFVANAIIQVFGRTKSTSEKWSSRGVGEHNLRYFLSTNQENACKRTRFIYRSLSNLLCRFCLLVGCLSAHYRQFLSCHVAQGHKDLILWNRQQRQCAWIRRFAQRHLLRGATHLILVTFYEISILVLNLIREQVCEMQDCPPEWKDEGWTKVFES